MAVVASSSPWPQRKQFIVVAIGGLEHTAEFVALSLS
jgi:hypothetical protein